VRRFGLLLAALLFLSAIGAATLVSLLIGRVQLGGLSAPAPLLALVAVFVLTAAALFFSRGMRRVGLPFGDIVASADRVAHGDYSARVVERGPPFLRVIARAFNGMAVRLEAQDRQRRDLMADIAHELRTPLAVIQGRLEGLLDGVYPLDAAQLAQVLEDTRVLARLVEDLRTLANAEAGSLSLRKEPTDLVVLMHDAAAAFATDARARDIAVQVEERGDLPLIDVDPLRVREVLTNLLANALRHTPGGGTVSVTAEALDAQEARDDRIVVRVADTGSGIPPEELPRIFERFYKQATSTGSGLGLTIARNLIVAHGGEIRAESEVGRGTIITFTLPVSGDVSGDE
jgi:two-component system OmpR family sensor kinase/two-component system sensor histidine kinase BaeS